MRRTAPCTGIDGGFWCDLTRAAPGSRLRVRAVCTLRLGYWLWTLGPWLWSAFARQNRPRYGGTVRSRVLTARTTRTTRTVPKARTIRTIRTYTGRLTRRLGFASLFVVVLAFAGASAGPAGPVESRRLVASFAWLRAEPADVRVRPVTPRVGALPPRSPARLLSLEPLARTTSVDRRLFQRPPPDTAHS